MRAAVKHLQTAYSFCFVASVLSNLQNMEQEFKFSKVIQSNQDCVRNVVLYADGTGASQVVTVSRDTVGKVYPVKK